MSDSLISVRSCDEQNITTIRHEDTHTDDIRTITIGPLPSML